MSTKTMKEKAAELLQKCEVVTLASVNKEGYPRPVPMSKIAAEGISTIWMSTGADSLKTIDFLSNPESRIMFSGEGGQCGIDGRSGSRDRRETEAGTFGRTGLSNTFPVVLQIRAMYC